MCSHHQHRYRGLGMSRCRRGKPKTGPCAVWFADEEPSPESPAAMALVLVLGQRGEAIARRGIRDGIMKPAPATITVGMLGCSPAFIEHHAIDSASAYAMYLASIHEQRG